MENDPWSINYIPFWTRLFNVKNHKDPAARLRTTQNLIMQVIYKLTALEQVLITDLLFFWFQVWIYPIILEIPFEEVSITIIKKSDPTSYSQLHVCFSLQTRAHSGNTEDVQTAAAACSEPSLWD